MSEPPLERASLIVPVGKDDARLARLLDELERAPLGKLEVVIVDNESRDEGAGSPGFARAAKRYQVVREGTRGKGAAVRKGMLAASRDLRVFTDVDLPYGFEGVRDAIAALARGEAPVVVGSRLVPGSTGKSGILRTIMSFCFRKWVAMCLGAGDLGDTQCGLKGFRADVARELFQNLGTTGFAFDCEILARAKLSGHAIERIPVKLRPEIGGSSIRVIPDSLRMFREVLRIRKVLRA